MAKKAAKKKASKTRTFVRRTIDDEIFIYQTTSRGTPTLIATNFEVKVGGRDLGYVAELCGAAAKVGGFSTLKVGELREVSDIILK